MTKKKKKKPEKKPARTQRRLRARPVRPKMHSVPARAESQPIIVGIGASAGGLEAFSQLLEGLGPDPGMAIVFVQHLAPQHDSALVPLLTPHTSLPVIQVAEGMRVTPNH